MTLKHLIHTAALLGTLVLGAARADDHVVGRHIVSV